LDECKIYSPGKNIHLNNYLLFIISKIKMEYSRTFRDLASFTGKHFDEAKSYFSDVVRGIFIQIGCNRTYLTPARTAETSYGNNSSPNGSISSGHVTMGRPRHIRHPLMFY
jgi:hypothetical protein